MQKIAFLSATVLATFTVAAVPATRPVTDLSPAINVILQRHATPALAGAVVDLEGTLGVGVAGIRLVGSKHRFESGDAVHLGSCTKSMTALLIGQLIDERKLSFHTTMAECFPAIAARMHPATSRVTVRHLLDNRAGLPANVAWVIIAAGGGSPAEQRVRVAEQVLSAKPLSTPGETYLYSNVGYTLLGAIIDARSGEPWESRIRAKIFQPLGMTSAGFGPPQGEAPSGHATLLGQAFPSRVDNPEVMGPAGRVHCSMGDWSRYIKACLRASRGDTELIKGETFRTLTTPLGDGTYAGGWMSLQRGWAGGRALTHTGSNGTWYCVAWLAPERGFAALAAANWAEPDAAKACDEVASMLIAEREPPKAESSKAESPK